MSKVYEYPVGIGVPNDYIGDPVEKAKEIVGEIIGNDLESPTDIDYVDFLSFVDKQDEREQFDITLILMLRAIKEGRRIPDGAFQNSLILVKGKVVSIDAESITEFEDPNVDKEITKAKEKLSIETGNTDLPDKIVLLKVKSEMKLTSLGERILREWEENMSPKVWEENKAFIDAFNNGEEFVTQESFPSTDNPFGFDSDLDAQYQLFLTEHLDHICKQVVDNPKKVEPVLEDLISFLVERKGIDSLVTLYLKIAEYAKFVTLEKRVIEKLEEKDDLKEFFGE